MAKSCRRQRSPSGCRTRTRRPSASACTRRCSATAARDPKARRRAAEDARRPRPAGQQRRGRHPGRLRPAQAEGGLGLHDGHPEGPQKGVHVPLRRPAGGPLLLGLPPGRGRRKDLVAGVCLLLDQNDIADLAIEDLRKWQVWDLADKVLALKESKAYETPIVRGPFSAMPCPTRRIRRARPMSRSSEKDPRRWPTRRSCSIWRRRSQSEA